jgi:hypothetical protein
MFGIGLIVGETFDVPGRPLQRIGEPPNVSVKWWGWQDSNLRMPESKSGALDQLGDTPRNSYLQHLPHMIGSTG